MSVLLRYRVYNDTLNALKYSMDVLVRINVLPRILVVFLYLLNEGLVLRHSFTYRWLHVLSALKQKVNNHFPLKHLSGRES